MKRTYTLTPARPIFATRQLAGSPVEMPELFRDGTLFALGTQEIEALKARLAGVGVEAPAPKQRSEDDVPEPMGVIPSEEARTKKCRISTGARRATWDWDTWREIDEELSLDPAHVRLERVRSGAVSFIKDHHATVNNVIGSVLSPTFEADGLYTQIRFLDDEDSLACLAKVNGGLRSVSVGYLAYRYEVTEEDGKRPVYRATDWELLEVSLVACPADGSAMIVATRSLSEGAPSSAAPRRVRSLNTPNKSACIFLGASRSLTGEESARMSAPIEDTKKPSTTPVVASSVPATRAADSAPVSQPKPAETAIAANLSVSERALLGAVYRGLGTEDPEKAMGALEARLQDAASVAQLRSVQQSMQGELDALKSDLRVRSLDDLVGKGILTPAEKTRAIEEKWSDVRLQGFVEARSASPIAPAATLRASGGDSGKATQPNAAEPWRSRALTPTETTIAKSLGISEEAYQRQLHISQSSPKQ